MLIINDITVIYKVLSSLSYVLIQVSSGNDSSHLLTGENYEIQYIDYSGITVLYEIFDNSRVRNIGKPKVGRFPDFSRSF